MEYQGNVPGTPREEPGQPRDIREIRQAREARSARETGVRIFLQPIASPWGLGLASLAITSFFLGAFYAKWYGTATTSALLFPFVLFFGGIVTLLAAMWMFRARDVLGTVALGIWGAYWMGYGLWNWVSAAPTFFPGPVSLVRDYNFLTFAVAAVTLTTAIAALGENFGVFATLLSLTGAAILVGLGQATQVQGLIIAAGYVFVLAALFGWYTATALMVNTTWERQVLPLGQFAPTEESPAIEDGEGEPGVTRHHRPIYYLEQAREKMREAKAGG
jgi:succinate-acetate transporter protein